MGRVDRSLPLFHDLTDCEFCRRQIFDRNGFTAELSQVDIAALPRSFRLVKHFLGAEFLNTSFKAILDRLVELPIVLYALPSAGASYGAGISIAMKTF
jgi:hypothetical protein